MVWERFSVKTLVLSSVILLLAGGLVYLYSHPRVQEVEKVV